MNKLSIAIILITCLLAGVAIGVIIHQYSFPSTGRFADVNLSVTFAENGTEVTDFHWGVTTNATPWLFDPLNVTNISNVPVTLVLTYDPASLVNVTSITLFWDYDNHILNPGDSTIVTIEQTVTGDVPAGSGYTYDTLITAVEYEEP